MPLIITPAAAFAFDDGIHATLLMLRASLLRRQMLFIIEALRRRRDAAVTMIRRQRFLLIRCHADVCMPDVYATLWRVFVLPLLCCIFADTLMPLLRATLLLLFAEFRCLFYITAAPC